MSPQLTPPEGIETVAVLGAGTIGASWTALFLARGLEVDVYDPSDEAESYVCDYVKTAWPSLVALGLAQSAEPRRPTFFATPEEAVRRARFVQESVPERLEVKHDIYRRIEPHLVPEAIVASSASGLMVREMQEGWRDPGRFILAHPFNPPHLIPLVELLANERTADGVLDRAEGFYQRAHGRRRARPRRRLLRGLRQGHHPDEQGNSRPCRQPPAGRLVARGHSPGHRRGGQCRGR
jgi:3-hydroxybutyryl-CoA dehydrogenase